MNTFDAANSRFLTNLKLIQARSDTAQQQMSSGYRVTQPSDDPSSVNDILTISFESARTTQVTANLSTVKTEVDTAESSLGQAVQLVQRIVSLGAQAASDTTDPAGRTASAQEISGLFDQLIGISQTQVEGRYVFSGDVSSQPMYQKDLANTNGVDRLFQTSATKLVEDATGMTFGVSHTAQDIFDHRNSDDTLASDNVFAAVTQLYTAMTSATATTADISTALDAVKTSADYLNTQQEFYGTVQNRIDSAQSTAASMTVRQKTDISNLRDADIAAAAIDVTQTKTALEAAMSAQSLRQRNTLFDYLK